VEKVKNQSNNYKTFIFSIENQLGVAIEAVKNSSLYKLRHNSEKKVNKTMNIVSHYPLIGRGTVLRDRTIDHQAVEKILDDALKD